MLLSTTNEAECKFADITIGTFATISAIVVAYYTATEGYWSVTGVYLTLMLANLITFCRCMKRAFDPDGDDTLKHLLIGFAILLTFSVIMGVIIEIIQNEGYENAAIILWFASVTLSFKLINAGKEKQSSDQEKESI